MKVFITVFALHGMLICAAFAVTLIGFGIEDSHLGSWSSISSSPSPSGMYAVAVAVRMRKKYKMNGGRAAGASSASGAKVHTYADSTHSASAPYVTVTPNTYSGDFAYTGGSGHGLLTSLRRRDAE